MLNSLEIVVERKKNVRGKSSILAVTLFKNPVLIYIFPKLAAREDKGGREGIPHTHPIP